MFNLMKHRIKKPKGNLVIVLCSLVFQMSMDVSPKLPKTTY